MQQKPQQTLDLGRDATGEARSAPSQGIETSTARASLERPAVAGPSMEAVIERENLRKALAQVKRNKGAAGIDGMTVDDLPAYLKEHWPTIRAKLLDGTYQPQPVRRVEIPKASGGVRLLGIPTVLDRFIQQAVMQVLQADWDGTFSDASFGFRSGRSAHQAVERAQAYIASGHAVVVDIDLEKFLDVASYYTFSFFERVEEVRSNCRYLNSYAFCPSAIDVNGLKLAALYTLQDGLPRDAE
ncbi:reverse transcriptase domain-containing protein [Bradyrhizobium sp. RDI18]|uniref:reverse transcriptase domain-containing protein n=1 Tax=Bradyrhizobium sp. RDI18 TaxID=3367400 RepID=UPI00371947F1